VARKIVTWALVDIAEDRLGYGRLDLARRELWGWPREERRFSAAERQLEISGLGPQQVIDWFGEQEPVTPAGAMALAGARRALGQTDAAASMIRHWWRTKDMSSGARGQMQARFGPLLRPEDLAAAPATGYAYGGGTWTDRRVRMNDALKAMDYRGAYQAVINHGLPLGADYAEAEFFAGWLQLRKLGNPALARPALRPHRTGRQEPDHPRTRPLLARSGGRGRGDATGAQTHYAEGARYNTTFYGQLAAGSRGRAWPPWAAPARRATPTPPDRARLRSSRARPRQPHPERGRRKSLQRVRRHLDDSLEARAALLVDQRGHGRADAGHERGSRRRAARDLC
jgi:hypothetical protein